MLFVFPFDPSRDAIKALDALFRPGSSQVSYRAGHPAITIVKRMKGREPQMRNGSL